MTNRPFLSLTLALTLLAFLLLPLPLQGATAESAAEQSFAVQTEEAGYYTLRLRYRPQGDAALTMSLFLDSRFAKTVRFEPLAVQADGLATAEALVYLPEGACQIGLRQGPSDGTVAVDSVAVEPRTGETKLIIVPHEDDEVLAFGGILQRLLAAGDDVRVAFITNGDYYDVDDGPIRIAESVAALSCLGLPLENIFLLGYPDSSIGGMLDAEDPTEWQEFPYGDTETYGNPDIPLYDYHTLQTGEPARLTQEDLFGDMEGLFRAIMPSEVYTTSYYDSHYDHSNTYRLVERTILSLKEKIGYAPLLHGSVIHSYYPPWPVRLTYAEDGTSLPVPFTSPFPQEDAPLDWEAATKVPLTEEMRERKYEAISHYRTQLALDTDAGFCYAFCKADEFYWTKDFSKEE